MARSSVYLGAALCLVALNLRPALVTIGPVLPQVGAGLRLSDVGLGALTSLPILLLGAASAGAPWLGRAAGWGSGIAIASALIAAGTALRSAGSVPAAFAGTVVLGTGIGLGNVFVPTVLKWQFPARLGLSLGLYTALLTLGSTMSVGITPLLLRAFHGDWRPTLGVWAYLAVASVAMWLPLYRLRGGERPVAGDVRLARNGLAWAVTAFMGLQSTLFYALAAWLGTLLQERGVSLPGVGLDLSSFFIVQVPGALLFPVVLVHVRRQGVLAALLAALGGIGTLGALYAPVASIAAWCALSGFTLGGVFAIALTFIVLRAREVRTAARLSAMAQTFGYLLASLGPFGLGLLHGAPDPRLGSAAWLAFLCVATIVAGLLAGRDRVVEGTLA